MMKILILSMNRNIYLLKSDQQIIVEINTYVLLYIYGNMI